MKSDLFLPVILATGKEQSRTEHVAKFVAQAFKDKGVNSELLHVSDFATDTTVTDEDNEQVQAWRKIADKADGLLVVSPEYNRGYPGELKILLDKAYAEYGRKPFGICTVSSGRANIRAAQQLEWTALGLNMVPVPQSVYFSDIMLDTQDEALHEQFGDSLEDLFEELIWYADALKAARK